MTNYLFTINGVDFSDVVHKYGYQTDLVPVYSKRVTTLDKVDHEVVVRRRGGLTITSNPLKRERAKELAAALSSLPGQIGYHSFQLGRDVTQRMRVTGIPMELVLKTPETDWVSGVTLTFEQL